jgi:hypothetical protein
MTVVGGAFAAPPDPQALADRIDARLNERLKAAKVTPAPAASDAEFHRRAHLDLCGRIPSAKEVHDFLADPSADKRVKLIDDLLDTPRHASHFAAVWRAALAPETAAVPEARLFQAGFEGWLRGHFRKNTRYDVLVRELIAVPISPDADNPTPALRDPAAPNPLAFVAVKEAKPENLAAATARVFLGRQIECAQCHDHPFDTWTQKQFWQTAAFFAGVQRSGDEMFSPLNEATAVRTLKPTELKSKAVSAVFLDGAKPPGSGDARTELAAWVTAKDNPYFAQATVNRVWGLLFGRGIVDPVDDFHAANLPSHPALLDELAKAFADADFDLNFLVRAVCRTEAYRRTSARTNATQDDPKLFARMATKGLTGEQLYDSLLRATGQKDGGGRRSARGEFLSRFAAGGRMADPETSIPQALALMNGKFVADATTAGKSPTLVAAAETPTLTTAERVEVLYVAALGRLPTEKEQTRIAKHLGDATGTELAEKLSDVFWALLNSAEFRLNH